MQRRRLIPRSLIPRILPLVMAAGLSLAGCAADRFASAEKIAAPAGLQFRTTQTTSYRLAAWKRMSDPSQPVHVYIEGDGLAWLDRNRPSPDPTPRHPLGLALAARDPAPNVIAIARPCMYVDLSRQPSCRIETWTDGRFDQSAIAAIDQALTQLKPANMRVHLVGYSGGAAIAAALAARRQDVVSLRTVAGNLDPAAITRFHRVSPMPTAIDIAAMAPALAAMPQRHFMGTKDTVIPAFVIKQFAKNAGRCAAVSRVVATHGEGWTEQWPALLRMPLPCEQAQ